MGGSRRENPKADAWSRAAPKNEIWGILWAYLVCVLYKRGHPTPCVWNFHTWQLHVSSSYRRNRRDSPFTNMKTAKTLIWIPVTLVLHVFIQPREMVTEHVTRSFGWALFQSMGFEHMPRFLSEWTNLHRALLDWLFFSFQIVGNYGSFQFISTWYLKCFTLDIARLGWYLCIRINPFFVVL